MSESLADVIKLNEDYWGQIYHSSEWTFPSKYKIINDPVYGTFKIDPTIVFMIDLPCFQRLRKIRQLGFSELVYPGTHHTRFEHSLGVCYLSKQFLSNLKENNEELETIIDKECIIESQIAALYHDVGHLPYSHVTEILLGNNPEINKIITENKYTDVKPHEVLSSELVKNNYIREAIAFVNENTDYNIDPDSIANLILGLSHQKDPNNVFLGQILHGNVDVDRIDYLCRDSHYAGVPFGQVDVGRIAQTLTTNIDKVSGRVLLATELKGIEAIEGLLVSRTLMYSSVYFHHTGTACSAYFTRLVNRYLQEEDINPLCLLHLDDATLMSTLSKVPYLSKEIRNLNYRRIPKTCTLVKASDISDEMSFESFMEENTLNNRMDLESKIGSDIIIEIPKYREYEEIHTYIKHEGSVQRITKHSKIIEGMSKNAVLGWSGFIFTLNQDRSEAKDRVSKYFKENPIGLDI
jgi:uncharacterized protein